MTHIFNMIVLGFVAGMLSGIWTRIIRPGMIFSFVGKWITRNTRTEDRRIADVFMEKTLTWQASLLEKIGFLLQCLFCLCPWLCFALDLFYIVDTTPHWSYAVVGVFASLGAGSFVSEIIYSMRNENL